MEANLTLQIERVSSCFVASPLCALADGFAQRTSGTMADAMAGLMEEVECQEASEEAKGTPGKVCKGVPNERIHMYPYLGQLHHLSYGFVKC